MTNEPTQVHHITRFDKTSSRNGGYDTFPDINLLDLSSSNGNESRWIGKANTAQLTIIENVKKLSGYIMHISGMPVRIKEVVYLAGLGTKQ